MGKIDVLLTFDLEFSAGGAFTFPDLHKPLGKEYVWLIQGNKSLGLGYVLEQLEKYGLTAVFYAETCNAAYHGLEEMGTVVKIVRDAGHDLQLHVHPAWLQSPHDRSKPRNDSMAQIATESLMDILDFSVTTFQKWLGKKPLSIRSGSLHVSKDYYKAVYQTGIPSSSSIGYSIYKSPEVELQKKNGIHTINKVIELPVSTIESQFLQRTFNRPFQITACSKSEMIHALEYAYKTQMSPVVILSHHFEFVKALDFRFDKFTRNNLVRRRFEALCLFLSTNRDRFNVTTIEKWLLRNQIQPSIEKYLDRGLRVPFMTVAKRIVENKSNESILQLRLAKAV